MVYCACILFLYSLLMIMSSASLRSGINYLAREFPTVLVVFALFSISTTFKLPYLLLIHLAICSVKYKADMDTDITLLGAHGYCTQVLTLLRQ